MKKKIFCPETVSEELKEFRDIAEIHIFDELASTNDTVRQYTRALSGSDPRRAVIVISEKQLSGRGRTGRVFYSPEGGIYMSVMFRPELVPEDLALITPSAAVAVCRALCALTNTDPGIKWVNDIYVSEKKVCGILTESFSAEGELFAVSGIGINMYEPKEGFPEDIAGRAAAVFGPKEKTDAGLMSRAAGITARELLRTVGGIPERSFADEYRSRSVVTGKDITVIRGEKRIRAFASGIDDDCRLVVKYGDGSTERLLSGEVSLEL